MATLAERFRQLTGEVVPDDGGEEDTFFTDATVSEILTRNNDNLYLSVLEGWILKEAEYAALLDISEGGSSRRLSQLYDHARRQIARWERVTGVVYGQADKIAVVARSAKIARPQLGPAEPPPPLPEQAILVHYPPGATLTARDTWSPDNSG